MAENKKSFVLYADLIHTVKKMSKAKAGELFLTILSYVNDENPVVTDLVIDLVFEPIKQQLKRDLKGWEKVKTIRSESGRLGGIKSGQKRSKMKQTKQMLQTTKQNEANEAVNVNVNVNDTVINGKSKFPYVPKIKIYPSKKDLEMLLPEISIGAAQQYFAYAKRINNVSVETIQGLWTVFKVKEFTGKNDYDDIGDIYTHFINGLKFEKLESEGTKNNSPGNLSNTIKIFEQQEQNRKNGIDKSK